jgi:hypothetical protein
VALAVTGLLAACGHGDDNHDNGNMPPVATTPPPPAPDVFFAYVSSLVASASDTTEPVATDNVAVTVPEDTEPQPLPGP